MLGTCQEAPPNRARLRAEAERSPQRARPQGQADDAGPCSWEARGGDAEPGLE